MSLKYKPSYGTWKNETSETDRIRFIYKEMTYLESDFSYLVAKIISEVENGEIDPSKETIVVYFPAYRRSKAISLSNAFLLKGFNVVRVEINDYKKKDQK